MENVRLASSIHLSAEDRGEGPDKEDTDDAHDEGEDGGEEEAPPFPLLIINFLSSTFKHFKMTRCTTR